MSFFFLLIAWCYLEALGCEVPNQIRTRVFDDFEHYRNNRVYFKPSQEGWQGSSVEFSTSTISTLPKDIFWAFDSESVISLKLSGKQIEDIEDGAFLSLLCLQELFLDRNNVTKLKRNVFPKSLRQLDLSHNQIGVLENSTFANLLRLKRMDLGSNRIQTVEKLAFINLTVLEYLNLENNQIKKVADGLFGPLPSLATLILSWNPLEETRLENWGNLSKLQNLELAGTNLNIFDPARIPFINLKSVNLSFNSLTVLNVVDLRRHLPKLEMIDLNNNPWTCDDLDRIIRDLNDSNIKVPSRNFSHVGINGVACGEALKVIVESTTFSPSTTSTSQVCIDSDELQKLVEKKFKENSDELTSTITSLRTFAILTFALLWIFIIFEVVYRTSVCGFFGHRTRRKVEGSADDDIEDFLHMKES